MLEKINVEDTEESEVEGVENKGSKDMVPDELPENKCIEEKEKGCVISFMMKW